MGPLLNNEVYTPEVYWQGREGKEEREKRRRGKEEEVTRQRSRQNFNLPMIQNCTNYTKP
jgi:hypothetical protein